MAHLKKAALLFLLLSFCFISLSQKAADVGMSFSTDPHYRIFIDYKKPFKDVYLWKVGFAYGASSTPFNNAVGRVEYEDSVITQRFFHRSVQAGKFVLGVEKKIKSSVFSYGVDAFIGYQKNLDRNSYHSVYLADEYANEYWYLTSFGSMNPRYQQSHIERHFMVPGFQLNISMDLPINHRFGFNLALTNSTEKPVHFKDVDRVDPNNVFNTKPNFGVTNDTRLSIGLRYKPYSGKT